MHRAESRLGQPYMKLSSEMEAQCCVRAADTSPAGSLGGKEKKF